MTGIFCFLSLTFTPCVLPKAQIPSYHPNIYFPLVFLALGFLGLQPTKFFFSHISFLTEAKCSFNCKDKIYPRVSVIEKHRCYRSLHCVLYLGQNLSSVALDGEETEDPASPRSRPFYDCPHGRRFFFFLISFLPNDLRVGLKNLHLPLTQHHSTSIVWGCFSAPTPQAIFSVEEEGKKFC